MTCTSLRSFQLLSSYFLSKKAIARWGQKFHDYSLTNREKKVGMAQGSYYTRQEFVSFTVCLENCSFSILKDSRRAVELAFQIFLNLPIVTFVLTPRGFLPSVFLFLPGASLSLSYLVLPKPRLMISTPIRQANARISRITKFILILVQIFINNPALDGKPLARFSDPENNRCSSQNEGERD